MEVTADNMDSVHALRHLFPNESRQVFRYAFDPSDHLRSAFEQYIDTTPGAARSRFLFYATRLVTLDTLRYPREEINAEFEFANKAFRKFHSEHFEVGRSGGHDGHMRVGLKTLGSEALKVSLLPKDPQAFNRALVGFAELGGERLPDEAKDTDRHYLYTIIPANLLNSDAIEEATRALSSELARADRASYYTVTPNSIERQVRPIGYMSPRAKPPN